MFLFDKSNYNNRNKLFLQRPLNWIRSIDFAIAMAAIEQQRKINEIFSRMDSSEVTEITKNAISQVQEQRETNMQSHETTNGDEINEVEKKQNPQTEDKIDKHDKWRTKKNRELGDLEENLILPSRLRSSSGRVYSSGMTIDPNNINPMAKENTPDPDLTAVIEEPDPDSMKPRELEDLDCCRNSSTMVTMMANLQKSVDNLTKEVRNQHAFQLQMQGKINTVEAKQSVQEEDISQILQELKETKAQVHTLSKIVIHQDQQITILNGKMVDMQMRSMHANIVISGIPEHKKEDLYKEVQHFIENELGMQELIPLEYARCLGTGTSRPILIQLRHPRDKTKIFDNVGNLKGRKNQNGEYFFVAEHLPDALNEQRRRQNDLMAENKKKPSQHKQDMKIQYGKLKINNKPYEKQIVTPTPRELLFPDRYTKSNSSRLQIHRGEDDIRNSSKFISYAAEVKDMDDIQAAYFWVKRKHAEATHVACAYRLPGDDTPSLQDFEDDGEFGAGRTMLKLLTENRHMNIATFLVRYYGGKHVGPGRFEVFRQVTSTAIKKLTKAVEVAAQKETEQNSFTQDDQETMDEASTMDEESGPE